MSIHEGIRRGFITWLGIVLAGLLLTACGGGGGGETAGDDGGDVVADGGISGDWVITETEKVHNCEDTLPLETFGLSIAHNGDRVAITDEDGDSVEVTIFGDRFIWRASYPEAAPDDTPGTLTIDPLLAIIDGTCDSLNGTASWSWVADDGSYRCSGITIFSGTKSSATGCGNFSFDNADVTPPDVPADFVLGEVSSFAIGLSWSPASDDRELSGYRIYQDDHYLATVSATEETRFVVNGLEAGVHYCFSLTAFDSAGNESISTDTQCATTLDLSDTSPPSVPSNLTVEDMSSNAETMVWLTWTPATDDVAVTGYVIYLDGSRLTYVGAIDRTILQKGLRHNTTHCFRVSARDAAGNESDRSAESCVTTARIESPVAPTNPSVNIDFYSRL